MFVANGRQRHTAACYHVTGQQRVCCVVHQTDGNGRAARLAMNFVLLSAGYPPVSISTVLRQDYYNALEAADSGDFQTWQSFLTQQLEHELDGWLSALEPSSSEN